MNGQMDDGWTQCEHVEDGERCGLVAYKGHTHCPEHATQENAECVACHRRGVYVGAEGRLTCPQDNCPAPWANDDARESGEEGSTP